MKTKLVCASGMPFSIPHQVWSISNSRQHPKTPTLPLQREQDLQKDVTVWYMNDQVLLSIEQEELSGTADNFKCVFADIFSNKCQQEHKLFMNRLEQNLQYMLILYVYSKSAFMRSGTDIGGLAHSLYSNSSQRCRDVVRTLSRSIKFFRLIHPDLYAPCFLHW